jgi:hypothetical protein
MTRMKSKTDTVHIRLTPELDARIRSYMRREGEDNTSSAIRRLIFAGLNAMERLDVPSEDAPTTEDIPFTYPV